LRAESRTRYSVGVRLRVLVLTSAAIALAVWVFSAWGPPAVASVIFFVLAAAIAELAGRVELPIGGLRVLHGESAPGVPLAPGFIVLVTAAFATRPSTALVVAMLADLPELLRPDQRNLIKRVFNAAQQAIYVGCASAVFVGLTALLDNALGLFVAAIAGALVAVLLNHVLVAVVVAAEHRVAMTEVLRRTAWPAPLSIGFGLVALLIATLYGEFGFVSALFLFMPLSALRVVRGAKLALDAATKRTLTDFARAVDEKDPYTYFHSDRVAMVTTELHRELGASAKDIDRRWAAAILHDVGKVAVPSEILSKTGPLTDDEIDLIKRHPGLGAEVVEKVDLFRDLGPEIRHHHERMDGRGYPSALSEENIPYAARVLAVADAFDALTSDRPYRRALSTAEALTELQRSAGQHHDPEIVAALQRVIAQGITFVKPEQRRVASPNDVPARNDTPPLRVIRTA
jgi:putative nucleotidyltransferase with HDIG domain